MSDEVLDWATDFDIFDPRYVNDPFTIWDDLRDRCPVAHTDRYRGQWLPTTYDDVQAIARDIPHFSSMGVSVVPPPAEALEGGQVPLLPAGVPPISADPPEHTWTRRLLLPWFSPQRVESYEQGTRELCRRLINGFIELGRADAAEQSAHGTAGGGENERGHGGSLLRGRRVGTGRDGGRERGREDEARGEAAHIIAQRMRGRDIAAHNAIGFGERAFNHIDLRHDILALANAAAARTIKANRMDFVHIGHGIIFLRQRGNLCHRRDIAIHGIEALKDNELGAVVAGCFQNFFKMRRVIVTEDCFFAARAANAFNHGIVVERIRNDEAIRQKLGNG